MMTEHTPEPLYKATLAHHFRTDAEDVWLELEIQGKTHDVYLGRTDDPHADIWRKIARLWIAAPDLLAVCRGPVIELANLAQMVDPQLTRELMEDVYAALAKGETT
jgi:hypothetical protein